MKDQNMSKKICMRLVYGCLYTKTFYFDGQQDLSRLIIYCRSKHIRPWSWSEQQKTSICNMFSFGESNAFGKCEKYPKGILPMKQTLRYILLGALTEMLACTERQLVRTYPAGLRTDSSNYNPIPLWNVGIHMLALNVQTPGK